MLLNIKIGIPYNDNEKNRCSIDCIIIFFDCKG